MADATPSRIGQALGTGATDALWLDIFGGEILTAFETACKFKDKIRTRTISSGKSARFPAMHRAVGQYHTAGDEIGGQSILHSEITLTTDDLLIAPAEIAQIDELKNHYDVRAPYSAELGRALALVYDRIASMSILKAARAAALFTGDGAGGSVQESDVGVSADFTTSGSDLWDAFGRSVQVLDEKDVPVDIVPVYGAVLPAQFYLMARAVENIDKDYGGAGSVQDNILKNAYGVNVFKSNALLFGRDVTAYDAGTNADGLVGAPNVSNYALPASFPAKYQADLTGSAAPVGLVWTDAAAGMLQLLGLQMESQWDMRRQVTFMLAKMACGGGPLRAKCAVEIKRTA